MTTNTTSSLGLSHRVLFLNTLAFTICFASWTMNGVLVTYLTDNGIYNWSVVETGWLLGIPILSGSIMRLPLGLLTDKFGGQKVFTFLLILCSIPYFFIVLCRFLLVVFCIECIIWNGGDKFCGWYCIYIGLVS